MAQVPNTLLTVREATDLVGCSIMIMGEWIDEGKLCAIDISTSSALRPCYRISKASALEMQKVCRTGAARGHAPIKKKVEKPSCMEIAVGQAKRHGMDLGAMSVGDWMMFDFIGERKAALLHKHWARSSERESGGGNQDVGMDG